MKTRIFSITFLSALFAVSFPSHSSAQEWGAAEKARLLLEKNSAGILGIAHATATHRNCEFFRTQPLQGGGFLQRIRIHFSDLWGDPGYSDLDFFFHANGELRSVGNGISNSGWPAYATSYLMLESFRALLLNDDSISQSDKVTIRSIPDAKSLLEHLLKMQQLFE